MTIGKEKVPLDKAAELDLNSKWLTALPESISELKALTKLNVSGNQLRELPATIMPAAVRAKTYVAKLKESWQHLLR